MDDYIDYTTDSHSEQHNEEQKTNPADVCVNCGAELREGQEFCTKCGTAKNSNNQKVCSNCGAELRDDQEFCTKCGQKFGLTIDDNVSSAISQFDSEIPTTKKSEKNKKKIIIIASGIAVLIIGLIIGGFFYFNGLKKDIISQLKSNSPDPTKISSYYKSLTPIGRSMFDDDFEKEFTKIVKNNPYVNNASEYSLVSASKIDEYKQYKEIATAIGLDSGVAVEYIDKVLKLEKYKKYNNLCECIKLTSAHFSLACDYIKEANSSDYQYLKTLYIGRARSNMFNAYTTAKPRSKDDLSIKYCDALQECYNWLNDYYNNGYNFSSLTAMSDITELVNECTDALTEASDITKNLPSIK